MCGNLEKGAVPAAVKYELEVSGGTASKLMLQSSYIVCCVRF